MAAGSTVSEGSTEPTPIPPTSETPDPAPASYGWGGFAASAPVGPAPDADPPTVAAEAPTAAMAASSPPIRPATDDGHSLDRSTRRRSGWWAPLVGAMVGAVIGALVGGGVAAVWGGRATGCPA